jgi:hypothetical protein
MKKVIRPILVGTTVKTSKTFFRKFILSAAWFAFLISEPVGRPRPSSTAESKL